MDMPNRVRRHIKKCSFYKEWVEIYTPLAFYTEPQGVSVLRELIGQPTKTKIVPLHDALRQLEKSQRRSQKLKKKNEKMETDLNNTRSECENWKTRCSKLEQMIINKHHETH